jgi:hypothetical protein
LILARKIGTPTPRNVIKKIQVAKLNLIRIPTEKLSKIQINTYNDKGTKQNKKIDKRYFVYIKILLELEFKIPIYPNFSIEKTPYLEFPAAR